jgi:hypothetical protein
LPKFKIDLDKLLLTLMISPKNYFSEKAASDRVSEKYCYAIDVTVTAEVKYFD